MGGDGGEGQLAGGAHIEVVGRGEGVGGGGGRPPSASKRTCGAAARLAALACNLHTALVSAHFLANLAVGCASSVKLGENLQLVQHLIGVRCNMQ